MRPPCRTPARALANALARIVLEGLSEVTLMKLAALCLVAIVSLPACAGPEELSPEEEKTAVLESGLAPCCGDGEILYFEWKCVCRLFDCGWEKLLVGAETRSCRAPFFGPLVGKKTSCFEKSLEECGGGSSCGCTRSECSPKPRTLCGAVIQP